MLSLLPLSAAPILAGGLIGGLGAPELIVILIVVLIIFGPKQLPKIGRALGTSIRELKDAANKLTDDEEEGYRPPRPQRPQGTVASSASPEDDETPHSEPTAAPKDDPPQKMSPGSHLSS